MTLAGWCEYERGHYFATPDIFILNDRAKRTFLRLLPGISHSKVISGEARWIAQSQIRALLSMEKASPTANSVAIIRNSNDSISSES